MAVNALISELLLKLESCALLKFLKGSLQHRKIGNQNIIKKYIYVGRLT